MGFNPKFIQLYCDEKGHELGEDLKQSILWRNGLECKVDKEIVKNPLYEFDSFTNAENILDKIKK